MTPLAPHLEAFLCEHLPRERACSRNTCETYAYAFQLLVCFAAERNRTRPSSLSLEQLDAPLLLAFLEHLETARSCSPSTRNARLAAVKSFARFVEYRVPSAIEQVRRILAIPSKKTDQGLIDYLDRQEIQALLDAPDPSTRAGTRDLAMLHLAFAAGLRVSELVGLKVNDVDTHPQASVHILGKGRRERVLPLWKDTARAIRAWIASRGDITAPELFLNTQDGPLTRSGFTYILAKHVRTATATCPSLSSKRVSPHVLRHSCALETLQATNGDVRKVSLWLGHASLKSTEVYLRADPSKRLSALTSGIGPSLRPGRFRPPDKLLAMLRSR